MTDEEWIEAQFERCWPYLQSAIDKMAEPYGKDHVWDRIVKGTAQFWPGNECAICTEIEVDQAGTKKLIGWLAGGNRDEIESITSNIEPWARRMGCVAIRAIQRPGFSRKPLNGYKLRAVVMEKAL